MRTRWILGVLVGLAFGIALGSLTRPSHAQPSKTTPTPEPAAAPVTAQELTYADQPRIGWSGYIDDGAGFDHYVNFDVTATFDTSLDPNLDSTGCAGGVTDPTVQDYSFYLEEGASPSRLYIGVHSYNGADVSLIVNDPSAEWFCSDQFAVQDASQDQQLEAISLDQPESGRYDIWVGLFGTPNDRVQLTIYSYPVDFNFDQ